MWGFNCPAVNATHSEWERHLWEYTRAPFGNLAKPPFPSSIFLAKFICYFAIAVFVQQNKKYFALRLLKRFSKMFGVYVSEGYEAVLVHNKLMFLSNPGERN